MLWPASGPRPSRGFERRVVVQVDTQLRLRFWKSSAVALNACAGHIQAVSGAVAVNCREGLLAPADRIDFLLFLPSSFLLRRARGASQLRS